VGDWSPTPADPTGLPGVGGPIRTCVGCRARRGQDRLIRLHLDDRDRLQVDRSGTGRGAWLCADHPAACLRSAIGRKALARAFRRRPDGASVAAVLEALGR
jgi:predicted RNA-binding protein YlxR (DUF448 family)